MLDLFGFCPLYVVKQLCLHLHAYLPYTAPVHVQL